MKTSLDIVSGFLGAGKTTFIQKLIDELYGQENVVVLENEYGKINLDGETLGRQGIKVESICAGCICCTSAGELSNNIVSMVDRYHPSRIIVEPTGLARLSDIMDLLAEPFVTNLCVVEHVITIVDARNYDKRMMISKEFFENQIRNSKVIILSKTQGMEPDRITEIAQLVKKIHPGCSIITQPWSMISADQLKMAINFGTGEVCEELPHDNDGFGEEPHHSENHGRHNHNHNDRFDSFSYESDELVGQEDIRRFLHDISAGRYGEIHRGKGVFQDSNAQWFCFEYVPGEARISVNKQDMSHLLKKFQLCIIGTELKKDLLQNQVLLTLNPKTDAQYI